MSGHSKWSTIKRKKEKTDAARGRIFTRLIKEITVAARQGGGDESTNPRLRSAISAAKGANMEVLTDNKNRTVAELRHTLSKYGGNMGETGCVSWMFEKRGVISVPADSVDEDELMMAALEAGAEDMTPDEQFYTIITLPENLDSVRDALKARDIPLENAEITMHPQNTVKVEGKSAESLLKMMDLLEDQDDIQNVYSNFDIDESVLEQMGG